MEKHPKFFLFFLVDQSSQPCWNALEPCPQAGREKKTKRLPTTEKYVVSVLFTLINYSLGPHFNAVF